MTTIAPPMTALALAASLLAACATTGPTLEVGGHTRRYLVHAPAHPPAGPMPLVIALHGGGGSAAYMRRESGFDRLADRDGFVVVYPEGLDHHWNDGRDGANGALPVDDVAFVRALIDRIEATYPIDPGRVFATGISNGAMMSYRLACDLGDRIAAIAPVVGDVPAIYAERCHPARPVSLMAINSTADPFVPWLGGQVHVFRDRGEVLGAEASVALIARLDRCAGAPTTAWEPDRDPDDHTRVWRTSYPGCPEPTAVELLAIDGGGHTWPGGMQYLPVRMIGRVSRELGASEAIWQFFRSHDRD